MTDFEKIAEKLPDGEEKKIFELLAIKQMEVCATDGLVTDAVAELPISREEAERIQDLMVAQVESNMILDGYQTFEDAKKQLSLVTDAYFNDANGIGTQYDPSMYNYADIPTVLSPQQATGFYASGGIARTIIDKKSYGLLMNGYGFEGVEWTEDECELVKKHADSQLFDKWLGDAIRDGLIYGGALLVPRLKGDNAATYSMDFETLLARGMIDKDCLDGFWEADRWNAVLIPDYHISAKSYRTPKEFFVPLEGLCIKTSRMSVIRPKDLPYWGAIRQMGWGISEFEGWIVSLMGYEIMAEAISTMFQQLNLMYHSIPLDGMLMQNGVDQVKEFAQFNSQQLANWSVVKHRTANVVGTIETIERNFAGMADLMTTKQQDVSSKTGFPVSEIWMMNPSGMASDREDDNKLKTAGTQKQVASVVIPQLANVVKMLVYSTFGKDSEQAKKADKLRLTFETPSVITETENADFSVKFSGSVASLVGGGMPMDMAVGITQEFFPSLSIDKEYLDRLKNGDMPTQEFGQPSATTDFVQNGSGESVQNNAPTEPSAVSNFVNPQPQEQDATPNTDVSKFVKGRSALQKFFDGILGRK